MLCESEKALKYNPYAEKAGIISEEVDVSDWRYDYRPDDSRDEKRLKLWRQQQTRPPEQSNVQIILVVVVAIVFSITMLYFGL